MRLILDTHFLIWLAINPDEISVRERGILESGNWDLVVSPVSIWELRLKWQARDRHGVRKGVLSPAAGLAFVKAAPIDLVELTTQDFAAGLAVPIPHKDPFDEMLLIHAQQLGVRLLTRDDDLRRHPLALQS